MGRTISIIDYIPHGHRNAVSRTDLCICTGLSDREIRQRIHEARRDNVILNVSDGKGYYRPDLNDPIDRYEAVMFEKQETARLKSIGWSLKAVRDLLNR